MGIPERVNVWVDVTATADRKLEALRCHHSQYESWEPLEERVRSLAADERRGRRTARGIGCRGFPPARHLLIRLTRRESPPGAGRVPAGQPAPVQPS